MGVRRVVSKTLRIEQRAQFVSLVINAIQRLQFVKAGLLAHSRRVIDVPLSFQPPMSRVLVKESDIRRSKQREPRQNQARSQYGSRKPSPFEQCQRAKLRSKKQRISKGFGPCQVRESEK